ncbi:hypothetical protein SAMN05444164_3302 [Bradyrhizobium erythrophlei]|uniref:Uncharacterized protein n=1 Tax=Bradyrhizobium erythrophlei TaxID=1437360 RepID=A0A1H4X103_9BRAD|nr:hypothetical protein SAMN05444164_3302 [Bradyrhizobium erythrophlei]
MLFYSLVVGRTGTVAPLKHASIYVACRERGNFELRNRVLTPHEEWTNRVKM